MVEHIFLKWGLVREILVDQGPEFEAELFQELLKLLGVVRLRTSSYRPQSNGGCEVWHHTLNSIRDDILEGPQSGNHISALRASWSSVSMTLLMS